MVRPSIGGDPPRSGRRPVVVVVGAASRDLEPTDSRGWRLGGTVTYAALAIARLGLTVRALIGVDNEAASAHELGLLVAAGVHIELARLQRGPVFDNHQAADGRRQVAHSASDRIVLRELPRAWRQADAALLGPIADELGPAWARAFPRSTMVALAWQGLLRRLVAGQVVEPLRLRPMALIDRADIAAVSAEDVRAGGARLDLLLRRRSQQLVVTHGRRPLLHLERTGSGFRGRLMPAAPVARVRDTTGAGDVLLATWCAALAAARFTGTQFPAHRALALATANAAAKVEADSLTGVADLAELCERLLRPPSAAVR